MKLDRRLTNGLAWAGVLLVVGVPTADLLSAQFMGGADVAQPQQVAALAVTPDAPMPAPLSQRPSAPAQQVAAATPAKPVAAKPAGQNTAVDSFESSGRPLPSYITGAPAAPAKTAAVPVKPAATTPAAAPVQPAAPAQVAATTPARTPIVTTPVAIDPIEVAALPPTKIAPVPMPLSMRPAPVTVALVQEPVVIPPGLSPAAPLGVVRPPLNVVRPPIAVTDEAELDDWETGPLSDFLARRQQQGAVSVAPAQGYQDDGYFFDDAQPRDRVIAREAPFMLFSD